MAKKKGTKNTRRPITKEELMSLGVTDVTEDGTVYVNGKRKSVSLLKSREHRYGEVLIVTYPGICLQDYSTKVSVVQHKRHVDGKLYDYKGWAYKTRNIPLGRLVYAWFHGEVPANMDIDHIDNNKWNNNINNLQMLTRKENLARRSLSWEEITRLYLERKREMGE